MTSTRSMEVTGLLKAWGEGDQAARDRLIPMVYDELHRMARRYMRRENAGQTLQTTAVVNEAYIRMIDLTNVAWQDRAHFFAVAARMMRRILVDAARARGSAKRGGHAARIDLDQIPDLSGRGGELIALDDALH